MSGMSDGKKADTNGFELDELCKMFLLLFADELEQFDLDRVVEHQLVESDEESRVLIFEGRHFADFERIWIEEDDERGYMILQHTSTLRKCCDDEQASCNQTKVKIIRIIHVIWVGNGDLFVCLYHLEQLLFQVD